MNESDPAPQWSPDYPDKRDKRVELSDFELQTFISDKRPGISVIDYPLESPACFWIDSQHVYLRVNWSQWCTVSLSSADHVAAICASHYCRITHSDNNELSDVTAPVYHIAELPCEILAPESVKETIVEGPKESMAVPGEYAECLDKVAKIVGAKFPTLSVFPSVKFDGDYAAIAVSSDSLAVLMDVLPEDRDFVFAPDTGKNRHNPMNRWTSNVVSLDFVTKLKRLQVWLKDAEPDCEIKIGLVANKNTLDELLGFADDDLVGFNLFTYENLADCLGVLFEGYLD